MNRPIKHLFGKWWVKYTDSLTGEIYARSYATEEEANAAFDEWFAYDGEDVYYERLETAAEQLAESRE